MRNIKEQLQYIKDAGFNIDYEAEDLLISWVKELKNEVRNRAFEDIIDYLNASELSTYNKSYQVGYKDALEDIKIFYKLNK